MTQRSQDRRAVQVLRQQAVDAVLLSHAGRSEQEVVQELRHQLALRGLPDPPATWSDAVASDLSAGRAYVVSARTEQVIAEDVERGRPASQDDLDAPS